MRIILCVATTLIALAAASCGGSSGPAAGGSQQTLEDVMAAVQGLDAEAREAKLLELAKAEGAKIVFWYSTMPKGKADRVIKAFEDAYGIGVTGQDTDSEAIVQRVTEEASAGVSTPDVIFTQPDAIQGLDDGGLLGPYAPGPGSLIPEEAVRDGGRFVGARSSITTLGWNTDLVAPGEAPRTWEELADPRWKGKLSLSPSDSDWYAYLFTYWVQHGKTEQEAQKLFEQIAANSVFVRGVTGRAEMLAAGDFSLTFTISSVIDGLARKGAPIAWQPSIQPAFVGFDGASLPKRPPHPAAAVLLVDWLISDAGQKAMDSADVSPSSGVSGLDFEYVLQDLDAYRAEREKWDGAYERLIALGTSIAAPDS
jgi:iron(III) transport system substrate-binding protein